MIRGIRSPTFYFFSLLLAGYSTVANATPTITSLSVSSATIGSSVTVNGTGFSATKASDVVKFNGTTATVGTATTTQLVVTVPSGATTGPLTVTFNGTATTSFSIIPKVTSFSPTSGIVTTSVTLSGSGFSNTAGSNAVTFNGVAATITSATATSLAVNVPSGSTTGPIAVTVGTQTGTSSTSFTVTPQILSFSPGLGPVGSSVTLTGEGFSPTLANNAVTIHGTAATVTSASAKQLIVTVPAGATTGTIKVTVGTHSFTTTASFTVTPSITSIDPDTAIPGSDVFIDGYNFSATRSSNTVKFNGVAAVVSSASTTELDVLVPAAATSGPITVTVGGNTATSPTSFTVLGPTIDSFSPASGPIGSRITILGENFDPTIANDVVKLNGIAAPVLYADSGKLVVSVPSGSTTGVLQVTCFNQTASSTSSFVVSTTNISLPTGTPTQGIVIPATAGQPLVVEIADIIAPNGVELDFTLLNPQGQIVADQEVSFLDAGNGVMFYVDPPASGNYSVSVSKTSGDGNASAQITLDSGQTANVDSPPVHVSSSLPGGASRINFLASAGSNLTVGIANAFTVSRVNDLKTILFNPDGTIYTTNRSEFSSDADCIFYDSYNSLCDFAQLPQTGAYTLVVLPTQYYSDNTQTTDGTFDADISIATEPTNALSAGTPAVIDLTNRGLERWTFSGSPGTLAFLSFASASPPSSFLIALRDPLLTEVQGGQISIGARYFNPLVAGTYTAVVKKTGGGGSMQIVLDPGQNLSIDASPQLITTTVTGQSQRFNFSGTQGQNLAMNMTDLALLPTSGTRLAFTLLNPDFTLDTTPGIYDQSSCSTENTATGGCGWYIQDLPQTGTYTLIAVPNGAPSANGQSASANTYSGNLSLQNDPDGSVPLPSLVITSLNPSAGPIGATIHILGQHFSPTPSNNTVNFAGSGFSQVSTVPTDATTSDLTVVVPEGTHTGEVGVVVGDQVAFASTPFTVAATITSTLSISADPDARLGSDYFLNVSIAPQDFQATGTVDISVSNPIGGTCHITLPSSGCALFPQRRGPVTVSASYSGDSHFTPATASASFNVTGLPSKVTITNVIPGDVSMVSQPTTVFFNVTQQSGLGLTAPVTTGTVGIADGLGDHCTFGGTNEEIGGGACSLTSNSSGTYAITANYSGDGVYEPSVSDPISHSTSSPGGANSIPSQSQACGFDPNASYPEQSGFVPVDEISGVVPSAGLIRDINGDGTLTIAIVSPSNNSTLFGSSVDVSGTFHGPVNTGITVNGIVARTVNNRFLVAGVPIGQGGTPDVLTATATMIDGTVASNTVTVSSGTNASPLEIERVDGVSGGFAPWSEQVAYKIGVLPDNATISSISIDFDGDGTVDWSGTDIAMAPTQLTFSQPGAYTTVLTVIDSNAQWYTATLPIVVEDLTATRSMLCDVYGFFKDRLSASDSNGAARAFEPFMQNAYQPYLTALGNLSPQVAPRLGSIANGFIGDGFAEMTLVRDNADQTRNGFPLRMTRGADGVWRISEM